MCGLTDWKDCECNRGLMSINYPERRGSSVFLVLSFICCHREGRKQPEEDIQRGGGVQTLTVLDTSTLPSKSSSGGFRRSRGLDAR